MVGRSVRTTKCCSSFWSSGVKQLMSVPTARRTARPDVGAPSGTFALTTILMPRCSSSRISSARSPAPHASIAASSALLGSGPTSNGGAAAVASIRDDGPFDGTSPPMVTLKLTRSMRAFVGSKDTSGAARTCKRSKWTSMIRRATTLCTRGWHEFRSKTQSCREFLRNGASRENAWRCELRDHSLSQSVMSRSPALTTFRLKGRFRCPRSTRVRRSKYSLSPQLSLPATHLLPKRSCSPSAQGDPRPEDNHTVLVCQPVENYRIPRNLLAVLRRLNPLFESLRVPFACA